jgi:hypothetical protein
VVVLTLLLCSSIISQCAGIRRVVTCVLVQVLGVGRHHHNVPEL